MSSSPYNNNSFVSSRAHPNCWICLSPGSMGRNTKRIVTTFKRPQPQLIAENEREEKKNSNLLLLFWLWLWVHSRFVSMAWRTRYLSDVCPMLNAHYYSFRYGDKIQFNVARSLTKLIEIENKRRNKLPSATWTELKCIQFMCCCCWCCCLHDESWQEQ